MTPSFTVSVDRARGRILTGLSKEASVQRLEEADLCREGDGAQARRTLTDDTVLICALPPAIIKRWAGGDAERRRAARAEASLDCT